MLLAALAAAAISSAADEAAVRALVDRYMAARALNDETAIGALFTPDADQFTTGGEWRRGRQALAAGTLRSTAGNPGARRIEVRAVRFPAPDVAIADGPYLIDTPTRRPMWTTVVAVRTPSGWRISAIRNAAPAALPAQ
jgi:uncharacterized protein (TIGR02246 family)